MIQNPGLKRFSGDPICCKIGMKKLGSFTWNAIPLTVAKRNTLLSCWFYRPTAVRKSGWVP